MTGGIALSAVLAISAATPLGLAWWVCGVGARSISADPAAQSLCALAVRLLPLVALQCACGGFVLGLVAGLASVAAAWMLMGWAFVLALNATPGLALRVSRWVGGTGAVACALVPLLGRT
ncbi:hypothetical protein OOZ63_20715 [Paucibacter sp. PLA-PC-4]|uniref:hypothetical protein n=1 Tax=Paucibacter sp. PLA-PC-4 TaxID=2993655 RepID=UPI00224B6178|nr:hypothetical protein [Paucibacter sp. PLA-PC-4]MCX2864255.1 hypothetical protein [Paucibacter sp. PLA-PC-4]